ncbi:MAG TPA: MarR family transcriptional regulator [Edaphobacter sp.]|jgi:DNA-binding MarR family transcriptional regulator|nr:MarR family transcriptional regulator [Edaphobacter sp.]
MKAPIKKKSHSSPRRRKLNSKDVDPSAKLHELAQQTERQLNLIQRAMRQRLHAEFARGNLTAPQRLVMSVLVPTQGLSLKQLSQAVSLAHSTVSGIVDRLVKQGLIERQPHSTDRRITLLTASEPVRKFMKTRMPELALHPLLQALRLGSPAELQAITKGLDTLAQLFSRTTTTPANEEEILDL